MLGCQRGTTVRAVSTFLLTSVLLLGSVGFSRADVGVVSASYSVNSPGALPALSLSGQSSCAITVTGNATGLSLTAQTSPNYNLDGNPQWSAASFPTGSTLSSNGTISGSPGQTLGFRPYVNAITGGTAVISYACVPSVSDAILQYVVQNGLTVTGSMSPAANSIWQTQLCDAQTTSQCANVDSAGNASVKLNPCSSGTGTASYNLHAITTATTTQITAASSGVKNYVCFFSPISSGVNTVTLEYSTVASCASSNTVLEVLELGANSAVGLSGVAQGNGVGAIFTTPANTYLCIVTSGTELDGTILTAQQ